MAVQAVATTGSLMRWLPESGPHHALVAAALAIVVGAAMVGRNTCSVPDGPSMWIDAMVRAARILTVTVVLHRLAV
ncbi:hypothetical protein GCM10025331_82340 [Actinoplanes utahensis]|nr:hypothetical protein Aut01nite_83600 [Actinoplanes utahensis]